MCLQPGDPDSCSPGLYPSLAEAVVIEVASARRGCHAEAELLPVNTGAVVREDGRGGLGAAGVWP